MSLFFCSDVLSPHLHLWLVPGAVLLVLAGPSHLSAGPRSQEQGLCYPPGAQLGGLRHLSGGWLTESAPTASRVSSPRCGVWEAKEKEKLEVKRD